MEERTEGICCYCTEKLLVVVTTPSSTPDPPTSVCSGGSVKDENEM